MNVSEAQAPNTSVPTETFGVNPGTGANPTVGLPREPAIDQYGRDTQCGGTNRAYYNRMFGTTGVVMSTQQMNQYYRAGEIIRCGDCSKGGPGMVICWLKAGSTAGNPGVMFNGRGMPQGQPPPSNYNTGPQPPPGSNFGKVCPPTMPPQQAAVQGCRFIGSVTGYDICANPNAYQYPQCRENATPGGGPSDYQIWVGVTMPTQNCERYNATHPGHHDDCSVWCRSFGRDTGAPGRPAKYPPICARYVQPQPAKPAPQDRSIALTTMHDVASLVFKLYNTGEPIEIIRASARNGFPRPTYVVLLAGTEFKSAQSNSALTDVSAALHTVTSYDVDILRAVKKAIPPGSDIIVAGHSLGGMAAQVFAQNLVTYQGWSPGSRVTRIITFGSPEMTVPLPEVVYDRYAVAGDPVPLLLIPGIPKGYQHVIDNGVKITEGIGAHLSYPDSKSLMRVDPYGETNRYKPLFLDEGTAQYFSAPNL